jgi:hypothetical protein
MWLKLTGKRDSKILVNMNNVSEIYEIIGYITKSRLYFANHPEYSEVEVKETLDEIELMIANKILILNAPRQ